MAVFKVVQEITIPTGKTYIGAVTQELEDQFQAEVAAQNKIIKKEIEIFTNPQGLEVIRQTATLASEEDYLALISVLHENPIVMERMRRLEVEGLTLIRSTIGYVEE